MQCNKIAETAKPSLTLSIFRIHCNCRREFAWNTAQVMACVHFCAKDLHLSMDRPKKNRKREFTLKARVHYGIPRFLLPSHCFEIVYNSVYTA